MGYGVQKMERPVAYHILLPGSSRFHAPRAASRCMLRASDWREIVAAVE
jgi:hypothetical protein